MATSFAEDLVQMRGGGGREADLGHQHDGRAAGAQHFLHGGEIDRGLAGAGDAVQQRDGKLLRGDGGVDLLQRGFLSWAEDEVETTRLQRRDVEVRRAGFRSMTRPRLMSVASVVRGMGSCVQLFDGDASAGLFVSASSNAF